LPAASPSTGRGLYAVVADTCAVIGPGPKEEPGRCARSGGARNLVPDPNAEHSRGRRRRRAVHGLAGHSRHGNEHLLDAGRSSVSPSESDRWPCASTLRHDEADPIGKQGGQALHFDEATRKYGNMVLCQERAMKTTVEVSDDLYRRAKAEAALRGRKLKDLVEEGLRRVLEAPRKTQPRKSLAGLMKSARGVIDSGVPDLASNPEHLADFGRNARRRR
jgi:hypothetical protein